MKNVLILSSSFPRKENSHEGGFILDLVKKIPPDRFKIIVLAPHFSGGKIREFWPPVTIYRFLYFLPARFERLAYGSGLLVNIRRDILAYLEVIPFCLAQMWWALFIFHREKIQIIHAHWLIPQGIVGGLFNFSFKIPHVATVHGTDLHLLKENRLLILLCRFIVRHSDIVTVNSNFMKRQVISLVPDSKDKIRVIPMGIEPEKFQSGFFIDFKKKFGAGHLILSVGRLIDWKGTIFLIEAMPDILLHYPDTKLFIIGSGPEKEMLVHRTNSLGLEKNILFFGRVSNEDLASHYHSADVFVLPSINISGKTEALGVVLLEAMASGCPVVGSNVGGIPDIITDGENGFLVPEQNPKALAEAIIRILSNETLKDKFRKNGLKRIQESFSRNKISECFSMVYDLVLRNYKERKNGL